MGTCGYAYLHLCMTMRDNHFEVPQSDVAAWESALDLMLQDLELSAVLRHPGMVEVSSRPRAWV